MTQFWFILSAIFIVLELNNPGLFFFLALSLGALATMFTNFENMSPVYEYAFFFLSSAIMFTILNVLVKTLQKQKESKVYASNTDLLIGKIVEITQLIDANIGYGLVDGELWMLKTDDKNHELKTGMHALIVGVKGCHLQIVPIVSNI